MKALLDAYRLSKYHNLICGSIFAVLALPFMVWGLSIILKARQTYVELIFPFAGLLFCILFGLSAMFRADKMSRTSF